MSRFFKPYEGNRPFFFVSYSHRQSEAVVDTIRVLHEKKYRLWYDEGIPAGSDWPANIARHMRECEAVVFFQSRTALASPNCFSEIRTADRAGKPLLVVPLDDSVPPPEWEALLAPGEIVPAGDSPAATAEALLRSKGIKRRFRRKWTESFPWRGLALALSLAFFLATAGAFGAVATGRWSPLPTPEPIAEIEAAPTPAPTAEPTPAPVVLPEGTERYFAIRFPDTQQESAVRQALGIPSEEILRWNLADVSRLYFCGNMVLRNPDGVAFSADGSCRVNGAPVIQGKVSDLSVFSDMVRLEELLLVAQPVKDLSPLSGLTLLRTLDLSGSAVADLRSLGAPSGLRALSLRHTAVKDLTPLEAMPGLGTVTVSRDMLPLVWDDGAPFAVVLAAEN